MDEVAPRPKGRVHDRADRIDLPPDQLPPVHLRAFKDELACHGGRVRLERGAAVEGGVKIEMYAGTGPSADAGVARWRMSPSHSRAASAYGLLECRAERNAWAHSSEGNNRERPWRVDLAGYARVARLRRVVVEPLTGLPPEVSGLH
ncbi:MAG: hypothetical protein ACREB9_08810, partial [Thermoplasmata archaeon]